MFDTCVDLLKLYENSICVPFFEACSIFCIPTVFDLMFKLLPLESWYYTFNHTIMNEKRYAPKADKHR